MLDKKYQNIVFSFFMALFMSGIMSFVISVFNLGIIDGIFIKWLQAWAFAFAVAFPTIIVVGPIVRKVVSLVIK